MKYVYAFLLFLLIACAGYYALRLLVPPLKKLWAGLVLTAVSLGCLVLLLGAFYVHEVPYTYETAWETMGAIWDGFFLSLKEVKDIIEGERAVGDLWIVLGVLALDLVVITAYGVVNYLKIEESDEFWMHLLSILAGIGTVGGLWIAVPICELLIAMLIYIISSIASWFGALPIDISGAIGGVFVIFLVGSLIWGATEVIIVIFRKRK